MIGYINYPEWIKPEVFAFLNLPDFLSFLYFIRWYGMMYIVAISIAYLQVQIMLKTEEFKTIDKQKIDDVTFWIVLGLLLGARILSCIVYDFDYYVHHPLEILVPFRNGKFTGFQGMSYHGGALGITIAMVIFVIVKKVDLRELSQICGAIPLGYIFGRLANFINGELYGRITSAPIGMLFPEAERLPLKLNDVQRVLSDLGWKVNEATMKVIDADGKVLEGLLGFRVIGGESYLSINLPRHPSQLYEAFLEGVALGIILWTIRLTFKKLRVYTASLYLVGYATARIIAENFRQPDSQFADLDKGEFTGYIFGNVTMGQILSFLMIIGAIGLAGYFYYLEKKDPLYSKRYT